MGKKNKLDQIIMRNSLRVPNDVIPTWILEAKTSGFEVENRIDVSRRQSNLQVLEEYTKKNVGTGKVTPIFNFAPLPFEQDLEFILKDIKTSKLQCSMVDPSLLNSLTKGNFLEVDNSAVRVSEWTGDLYLTINGSGYKASPELLSSIQTQSLGMFIFKGQFHALPFSHIQYLVDIDSVVRENKEKEAQLNAFVRLITLEESKENQLKETANIDGILGHGNWNVSVTTKASTKSTHATIKDSVSINGKVISAGKALCSTKSALSITGSRFIDEIEFRHNISCLKCRELLGLKPL